MAFIFSLILYGTAGLPKTIKIRPILPDSNIKNCGKIVVSSLGRIRTATGNWDGAICNTIGDRQDNYTTGSVFAY